MMLNGNATSTVKVIYILWHTVLVVEESSEMPEETTDLWQVTIKFPHLRWKSQRCLYDMDGWVGLMPLSTAKFKLWHTFLVMEESSEMPEEINDLWKVTIKFPHLR